MVNEPISDGRMAPSSFYRVAPAGIVFDLQASSHQLVLPHSCVYFDSFDFNVFQLGEVSRPEFIDRYCLNLAFDVYFCLMYVYRYLKILTFDEMIEVYSL